VTLHFAAFKQASPQVVAALLQVYPGAASTRDLGCIYVYFRVYAYISASFDMWKYL